MTKRTARSWMDWVTDFATIVLAIAGVAVAWRSMICRRLLWSVLIVLSGASVTMVGGLQAQERWKLGAEPLISVGELDGDEAYLLAGVKDAVLLSDTTLVVMNWGRTTFSVRYYGLAGKHLRTVGGRGDGPYELSRRHAAYRLFRRADDGVVIVGASGKIFELDRSGNGVRSGRVRITGPPTPMGYTEGQVVMVMPDYTLRERRSWLSGQAHHQLRVSLDALSEVDTIASGDWNWAIGPPGTEEILLYPPPFYSGPRSLGVGGGVVWVGDGAKGLLEVQDMHGRTLREIEVATDPRPVTRELRREYEERLLRYNAGEKWEEALRNVDYPETMPRFQRLEVDEQGRAWVLKYELPLSKADFEWSVYSTDGKHVADLTVPYELLSRWCVRNPWGVCPTQAFGVFGDLAVLVSKDDEWGVERVKVFRIES